MTIRFLQTCPSENPEYPFVAGQVISVPAPSAYLLELLDGVRAEAVKAADERAVIEGGETPEPAVKGRRRRGRL